MKIKETYTDFFSSHSQCILLKRVDSLNSNLPARHALSRLKVDPYSLGESRKYVIARALLLLGKIGDSLRASFLFGRAKQAA